MSTRMPLILCITNIILTLVNLLSLGVMASQWSQGSHKRAFEHGIELALGMEQCRADQEDWPAWDIAQLPALFAHREALTEAVRIDQWPPCDAIRRVLMPVPRTRAAHTISYPEGAQP